MRTFENYRRLVMKKLLPRIERMDTEIHSLREEWNVIRNPKLVGKIEESIEQKRRGKLNSWDEFKRLVDEK